MYPVDFSINFLSHFRIKNENSQQLETNQNVGHTTERFSKFNL